MQKSHWKAGHKPWCQKGGLLAVGAMVVVHSLTGATEINELQGVVRSFDEAAGRYVVTVEPPHGDKRIRPENVRPLQPDELRPSS